MCCLEPCIMLQSACWRAAVSAACFYCMRAAHCGSAHAVAGGLAVAYFTHSLVHFPHIHFLNKQAPLYTSSSCFIVLLSAGCVVKAVFHTVVFADCCRRTCIISFA